MNFACLRSRTVTRVAREIHTAIGKKVFQFPRRRLTLESVGSKRYLVATAIAGNRKSGEFPRCEGGFDHFGYEGLGDLVARVPFRR